MKLPFCILILFLTPTKVDATFASCFGIGNKGGCYTSEWIKFLRSTARIYDNEMIEEERFLIFQENMQKIAEHNALYKANASSFKLKMNKFGDLTASEFRAIMFGTMASVPITMGVRYFSFSNLTNSPRSIDLRQRGMVTQVKDQGYTATGGIFSAIGALEAVHYRNTKKLMALSEQHVLDCAPRSSGGKHFFPFSKAVAFLTEQGSIASREYPFEGSKKQCRSQDKRVQMIYPPLRHVAPGDRAALEIALDIVGPVAIQMPASSKLQFYKSGVFDSFRHPKERNFAALIVGYGTDPIGGNYWLVKNSFGVDWGMKGYVKIVKGENDPCVRGPAHFPHF